jgi:HD-GYP domain-containing protein (c-di-GMP phosphodiesterase class II)
MSHLKSVLSEVILHSLKVAAKAFFLGYKANLRHHELFELFIAALFHDVGKLFLDKDILFKKGSLSPAEKQHIDTHSNLSVFIASLFIKNKSILFLIKNHHSEESESLSLNILRRADIEDALKSKRAYKEKVSHEKVKDILLKEISIEVFIL